MLKHGDFSPGTKLQSLYICSNSNNIYTVLDPPRTSRGKLRLEGPKGGYVTTWWTKNTTCIVIIK